MARLMHLRRAPVMAAGLLLCALASVTWAQGDAPNVAELRRVIAVRDAQALDQPQQVVSAAQIYLAEFENGRHADEVLLALAQGHAGLSRPELALQTYNRLIDGHPESPFREQALTETLPLLQAEGDQGRAFARVDALIGAYPNSLQRSAALLWKASAQHEQGDSTGVLETLALIEPQQDLAEHQEARYYRLQTLALVKTGRSAWTPLQRYLKRNDSPERKAEVLMVVGQVAREAERPDEALRFYGQVVEDYPVAQHVGEALYWRAELFARTRLESAPEAVRGARRETAIGYYSAYLQSDHAEHRAAVLVGRGRLQQAAGRQALALADYEQAAQIDPERARDPELVRAWVAALQALERPAEAVALLERVRVDPALDQQVRTGFQVQLAALHYEAKGCDRVEELLNPMPIIADPQLRPRAFFMRGFCRYQRGEWEKATFDLEGLINDPNYQHLALAPLLDSYEKSGQTSRLVNLAEELLAAKRVPPDAPLMIRLADGYDRLGEPALMLSAFQRLEAVDPAAVQAPEIQLRMGVARERLGHKDAAAQHYLAILNRPDPATVPPDVYLTALERLQGLYLEAGREQELPPLHEVAAGIISGPDGSRRLAVLRRDLEVALARRRLLAGEAAAAVAPLEAALRETPPDQTEGRARTAALLVLAYAASGEAERAKRLYDEEASAQPAGPYRAALATELVTTVQAHPAALQGPHGREVSTTFGQALGDLPPEQTALRYQAAQLLDGAYRERGDHAARAALVTALLKDGLDEPTKQKLRLYQGQIYKDWGRALLEQGDVKGAEFQLQRGLELAAEGDWRERYELTALMSRAQLQQGRYTEVVLSNEAIRPEIEDAELSGQVRDFLGQVYVEWGKTAEKDGNTKSARIRYQYALDYLPPEDWQRRLAATNGLAAALQAQERTGDAVAAYEAVLPQIQDPAVQQQYNLYLGRLYAERVGDPEKASQWLRAADTGGKDDLSLEAGYLWADQQLVAKHPDPALTRLTELATRGLADTKWEVPVHYRIAVLLHERKQLKEALAHYRIVAGAKGAEVRKLYPKSIQQSKVQARRIENFLKAGGGSGTIAVPTIRPD